MADVHEDEAVLVPGLVEVLSHGQRLAKFRQGFLARKGVRGPPQHDGLRIVGFRQIGIEQQGLLRRRESLLFPNRFVRPVGRRLVAVGERQVHLCRLERRIDGGRLLEQRDGLIEIGLVGAQGVGDATQIEIERGRVDCPCLRCRGAVVHGRHDVEGTRDRRRDVAVEREEVAHAPVVGLLPHLPVVRGVDQFNGHAHAITGARPSLAARGRLRAPGRFRNRPVAPRVACR